MAKESTVARERTVNTINAVNRGTPFGVSRRTLSAARQYPNQENIIQAGIVARAEQMMMNAFGTENSTRNVQRINRAAQNMLRRFR